MIRIAVLIITILSALSVFAVVDTAKLWQILSALSAQSVAVIVFFVILNFAISFIRFLISFRILGLKPSFALCIKAFIVGHIGNQFIFSLIGQAMGRSVILSAGGLPASAVTFLSFLERALALISVLMFAIVGGGIVLGGISIDMKGGGEYLVYLLVSLPLLALLFAGIMWRHVSHILLPSARQMSIPGIIATFGLTILAHAAMLTAFVAALNAILPIQNFSLAAGALSVVMMLSALPISFSGWGIRELSAIYALGAIGVPAESGAAVGVLIGLASFGLVVLCLIATLILPMRPSGSTAPSVIDRTVSKSHFDFDRTFVVLIGLTIAFCVFFQIRVPMPTHQLNVNLADIFALAGMSIAIMQWRDIRAEAKLQAWFYLPLLIIGLVIVMGIAVGYVSFGSSTWAMLNRGVGWLIIMSYCAIGLLLVRYGQLVMMLRVLQATLLTVTIISALEVLTYYVGPTLGLPRDLVGPFLEGYAFDRNAFALQSIFGLLIWGFLISVVYRPSSSWHWMAPTLLIAAILMTESRTGWVLLIASLLALTLTITDTRRHLTVAVPLAAFMAYGPELLLSTIDPRLAGAWLPQTGDIVGETVTLGIRLISPASDLDRWLTISRGLELWQSSPLIGVGLGGFIADRIANGLPAQVIHSVPVWILAETGIIGFLAVTAAAAGLVLGLWQRRSAGRIPYLAANAALLAIGIFALGALVHDFFYQRIIWFSLGLLGAMASIQPRLRLPKPVG